MVQAGTPVPLTAWAVNWGGGRAGFPPFRILVEFLCVPFPGLSLPWEEQSRLAGHFTCSPCNFELCNLCHANKRNAGCIAQSWSKAQATGLQADILWD